MSAIHTTLAFFLLGLLRLIICVNLKSETICFNVQLKRSMSSESMGRIDAIAVIAFKQLNDTYCRAQARSVFFDRVTHIDT